jgi:hypothetical protein
MMVLADHAIWEEYSTLKISVQKVSLLAGVNTVIPTPNSAILRQSINVKRHLGVVGGTGFEPVTSTV